VLDTLVDKAIALAVQPTVILLGNGWNPGIDRGGI
jgi:hypothetical protein